MNNANVADLNTLHDGLRLVFGRTTRRLESYGADIHPDLIKIEQRIHNRLSTVLSTVDKLQNAPENSPRQESIQDIRKINETLCMLVMSIEPDSIKSRAIERSVPNAMETLSREFETLNTLSDKAKLLYDAEKQTLSEPEIRPVNHMTTVPAGAPRNDS